jgi:hypothetical protein
LLTFLFNNYFSIFCISIYQNCKGIRTGEDLFLAKGTKSPSSSLSVFDSLKRKNLIVDVVLLIQGHLALLPLHRHRHRKNYLLKLLKKDSLVLLCTKILSNWGIIASRAGFISKSSPLSSLSFNMRIKDANSSALSKLSCNIGKIADMSIFILHQIHE